MVRCSFCENVLRHGTGKIFVKKSGKLLYFCSMKCEKNMLKLKRKGITRKWTMAFRKIKEGKR